MVIKASRKDIGKFRWELPLAFQQASSTILPDTQTGIEHLLEQDLTAYLLMLLGILQSGDPELMERQWARLQKHHAELLQSFLEDLSDASASGMELN